MFENFNSMGILIKDIIIFIEKRHQFQHKFKPQKCILSPIINK